MLCKHPGNLLQLKHPYRPRFGKAYYYSPWDWCISENNKNVINKLGPTAYVCMYIHVWNLRAELMDKIMKCVNEQIMHEILNSETK